MGCALRPDRGGYDRHARNVAGLASQTHRAEIRWQFEERTGTPSHGARDRGVGHALGGRESRLGYRRIQGAFSHLGHELARSTISDILARHGLEPAPERNRKTTWKEFLTRHWELIV